MPDLTTTAGEAIALGAALLGGGGAIGLAGKAAVQALLARRNGASATVNVQVEPPHPPIPSRDNGSNDPPIPRGSHILQELNRIDGHLKANTHEIRNVGQALLVQGANLQAQAATLVQLVNETRDARAESRTAHDGIKKDIADARVAIASRKV